MKTFSILCEIRLNLEIRSVAMYNLDSLSFKGILSSCGKLYIGETGESVKVHFT